MKFFKRVDDDEWDADKSEKYGVKIKKSDFTLPKDPNIPNLKPVDLEKQAINKITTSELKQMVKNAIREIKKDLKNKR